MGDTLTRIINYLLANVGLLVAICIGLVLVLLNIGISIFICCICCKCCKCYQKDTAKDGEEDDEEMLNVVTATLIEMTPRTSFSSALKLSNLTNSAVQKVVIASPKVSVSSASNMSSPTSNATTVVVGTSPVVAGSSSASKKKK